MSIRPNERQFITDIFLEEIAKFSRKIEERLSQFECSASNNSGEVYDSVRRFYEDLTDKPWSEADEEALKSLGEINENEVKAIMREAYRRSQMHPIPSFVYLLNLLKKADAEAPEGNGSGLYLYNPDAIPAAERERIANILHNELLEAASELASRLNLGESKADVIREQLQVVEGRIVGRFTPLV